MIGRILLTLVLLAVAGFVLLVLIGLWDPTNRKPEHWDSAGLTSGI